MRCFSNSYFWLSSIAHVNEVKDILHYRMIIVNFLLFFPGGGTGFIGKALVGSLKQAGHDVTIISRTKAPGRITWVSSMQNSFLCLNNLVFLSLTIPPFSLSFIAVMILGISKNIKVISNWEGGSSIVIQKVSGFYIASNNNQFSVHWPKF